MIFRSVQLPFDSLFAYLSYTFYLFIVFPSWCLKSRTSGKNQRKQLFIPVFLPQQWQRSRTRKWFIHRCRSTFVCPFSMFSLFFGRFQTRLSIFFLLITLNSVIYITMTIYGLRVATISRSLLILKALYCKTYTIRIISNEVNQLIFDKHWNWPQQKITVKKNIV